MGCVCTSPDFQWLNPVVGIENSTYGQSTRCRYHGHYISYSSAAVGYPWCLWGPFEQSRGGVVSFAGSTGYGVLRPYGSGSSEMLGAGMMFGMEKREIQPDASSDVWIGGEGAGERVCSDGHAKK